MLRFTRHRDVVAGLTEIQYFRHGYQFRRMLHDHVHRRGRAFGSQVVERRARVFAAVPFSHLYDHAHGRALKTGRRSMRYSRDNLNNKTSYSPCRSKGIRSTCGKPLARYTCRTRTRPFPI